MTKGLNPGLAALNALAASLREWNAAADRRITLINQLSLQFQTTGAGAAESKGRF